MKLCEIRNGGDIIVLYEGRGRKDQRGGYLGGYTMVLEAVSAGIDGGIDKRKEYLSGQHTKRNR
jgi:hypothetical protein